MNTFDLVIRGGTVVTAADVARADVAIRDGKIMAVGLDLPKGKTEFDASGLLVMLGGIDSHVHLAQPAFGGPAMADDFERGTRSAIAGDNTTVLPFALQSRGMSLRKAVEEYHREADGLSSAIMDFT
jgi:dihydropyrimidinase